MIARSEAQVIRLSLIYALLDSQDVITFPHLDAALAVWAYCEAWALRIFGAVSAIQSPTRSCGRSSKAAPMA